MRELKEGSRFFETKAGKRLLKSVQEKMDIEGFTENSFKLQKKNRWRLEKKTFFDIFKEITDEDGAGAVADQRDFAKRLAGGAQRVELPDDQGTANIIARFKRIQGIVFHLVPDRRAHPI